ncbi:MAG: hypothetical protein E6G57_11220 [Actinobacteria bacterium]|nr:MAG: hypothetical protein E6G57_11220 [Actinomycetota bacterium]
MVVDPSAKYQLSDADDAHPVTLAPSGPPTPTSAAAAPPSSSTVAATNGAFTVSWARNTARDTGGIVTG